MEQFIARLLESSEVIIVMGLAIGALYKMLMDEKKQSSKDRTSHKKALKEINDSNALAIKAERDYIRDRDLENLEILTRIESHLSKK